MIDPNGLIMDYLQQNKYGGKTRTYRGWIRIREDPELLAQIRWYTAPPGAAVFPGIHAFGSAVWDQFQYAEPPSGLGVVDFDFNDHCPDFPPPGITGISTNTPLDWFLNGVPAGVVGPWPNPPCEQFGEPWIVRWWARPGGSLGTSVIPLAGLQVAQFSLRSCVNRWQVMLWTNPAYTPGSTSQYTDLTEATYQGYSRQSPVFSTTQQQADGSSVTVSAPLAFVFGGGAPLTVYGWALVDVGSQQIITLAKLATPQVMATPGVDRVFIPSFWFVLSPFQPTIPQWTGAIGLGIGVKSVVADGVFGKVGLGLAFSGNLNYKLTASGCGVSGTGFDWSAMNGTWTLTYDGTFWNSTPVLLADGNHWRWQLGNTPFTATVLLINQLNSSIHTDWHTGTWDWQSSVSLPENPLSSNIPGPALFPVTVAPA